MKHAHVACGSLWVLISLVIPALILSHAISPGDCSLFSKGNEKVSLRRATKSLQRNKKTTFTAALWLFSSLPFSWAGCTVTRSGSLLELQSVPPSHTQPSAVCVYFPAVDAGGKPGYRAGRADRCWAASPAR